MNTTRTLRIVYLAATLLFAFICAAFYCEILPIGSVSNDDANSFWLKLSTIGLTIIFVPFSLKLLTFKSIKALIAASEESYQRWGIIRILILTSLIIINLVQYFALGLYAPSGYLALIVMIAMLFVWPSDQRMMNEREA